MGNGPKPVTSTSTRANNSHLEEKMKATMEENTQLKNEVQELKMKFERYEKYEELLAALAAERSTQDWYQYIIKITIINY